MWLKEKWNGDPWQATFCEENGTYSENITIDPRLDARFLPQHVDPPINWVVTWLWSIVKRLEIVELSEIRRYISLQIIIIITVRKVKV